MKQLNLVDTKPRPEPKYEGLALQYRPQDLDQMYGNEKVLASIRQGLESNRPPRSYIFTGESGTGKTTLSRIIARHHQIPKNNLIEIDAATFSSVESMRRITETNQFVGTGSNRRMIIIDEAHMLSKSAWAALLKPIEESREGLYWSLCTTEEHKIPKNILSRCQCFTMRPLDPGTLTELLSDVNRLEKFGCSNAVLDVIVEWSNGSPRVGLQRLEQVRGIVDPVHAEQIIARVTNSKPVIELIRLIANRQGFTWNRARDLLKILEDQDPESTRLICVDYVSKMLLNAKTDTTSVWLLSVLEAFSKPMYSSEKMAPLLLAVGRLCFSQEDHT
jgi:DNA polymerase III gamma/tau subunit